MLGFFFKNGDTVAPFPSFDKVVTCDGIALECKVNCVRIHI